MPLGLTGPFGDPLTSFVKHSRVICPLSNLFYPLCKAIRRAHLRAVRGGASTPPRTQPPRARAVLSRVREPFPRPGRLQRRPQAKLRRLSRGNSARAGPLAGCRCEPPSGPSMLSRLPGVIRAPQMGGRIRGPLRLSAVQQQPRNLPHARTAQKAQVGLSEQPRTLSSHAGRTATLDRQLDRHVSIESWEEELKGRKQHSTAVRRAQGSSSITPWRRSSAGL